MIDFHDNFELDAFEQFTEDEILTFYGVYNNEFKLNNIVWEAIEDEGDGYRSLLECIVKKDSDGIFFSKPIAAVKVNKIDTDEFKGYEIVDIFTYHIWLKIGTDSYSLYYPQFIFEYTPDRSQTF